MGAGFCIMKRVDKFRIFPEHYDASSVTFLRVPISLNLVARPCVPEGNTDDTYVSYDGDLYKDDYVFPSYDPIKEMFYHLNTNQERVYEYNLHKDEMKKT